MTRAAVVHPSKGEPWLSFAVRPIAELTYTLQQIIPDMGEAFKATVVRVDTDWDDPRSGWVTMKLEDGSVMKRRAWWP